MAYPGCSAPAPGCRARRTPRTAGLVAPPSATPSPARAAPVCPPGAAETPAPTEGVRSGCARERVRLCGLNHEVEGCGLGSVGVVLDVQHQTGIEDAVGVVARLAREVQLGGQRRATWR